MSRHRPRVSSADLLRAADALAVAGHAEVAIWLRGEVAEREELSAVRQLVKAHGLTLAQAREVYRYELEGIKKA